MTIVMWVVTALASLIILNSARKLFKKYKFGFYYIDREEEAALDALNLDAIGITDYSHSMDLRGTPTHQCVCGCHIWNIKAIFDNFEIATYFLEMECAHCGSVATAPTPIDRESME